MNARRLTLSLLATSLAALAFTAAPALAALETPEKEVVSAVTATTAHVSGVLNPNAGAGVEGGFYGFQFGVSEPGVCGAERTLPEPFPGAGISAGLPEVKEETLTGLQPHAKYTVCLLELNEVESEQVEGAPVSFETKAVPPGIESESVTLPVKATEAHLEGVVNPNNQLTECHFQYGEKALSEYNGKELSEKTVACEPPTETLKGFGGQGVGVKVGGLNPKAIYHYRIVAKNGTGEEEVGKEEEFETETSPETPEVREAAPVAATEATFQGIVNPNEKGSPGSYEFLYRQSATECQRTNHKNGQLENEKTTTPEASQGGEQEAAHTLVKELLPGTTYTFCLLAHNEAGEESALSAPQTFTTLTEAPAISGEYVTKVQATAVTLNAQIDPGGAKTTYFFEYGSSDTYGTSSSPTELEGSLTATDTGVATIGGLEPGTTYHYHVVAINAHDPSGLPGDDETFTTPAETGTAAEICPKNAQARAEQPYGQALPDCRAYELVSPLDKNDRGAEAVDSRASISGEAVTYTSRGSFFGPQGATESSRYISRRGATGWSTQNVTPSSLAYETGRVPFAELLFTPDLSQGLVLNEDVPLVKGEEAGYDNLYVANLASTPASYQTVSNVNPPGEPPYNQGDTGAPKAVGVSTDLSHVVFQQGADLTANAEGNGEHVYEWVAGKLSLVDVPPAGTKFEGSDTAGAPGNSNLPDEGDTWHAVSDNGLRVFFTAGATHQQGEGQLYVRENPEQEPSPEPAGKCTVSSDACTVEVSASQRTDCADHNPCSGTPEPDPNGPQPAYFRDASAAGTRVFFTSRAELTNEANTDEDNVANLYEYNLETGTLSDLTAENPEGAAVLGLVTASENAGEENSYVYFVANGVLASNENSNKETAKSGDCRTEEVTFEGERTCSLYVEHYTGGQWGTRFIATLVAHASSGFSAGEAAGDEKDWLSVEGGTLDRDYGPGQHTVRVTPDGTTLAFESERSLTGYDNEPVEPGAGAPGHQCTENGGALKGISAVHPDLAVPCREVYLYDAVTEKLVCASCDSSGARPVGPAELGGQEDEEGNGFVPPSTYYLSRNLSENGGRLFFQSPDALVPHDSNNQLDVYEWERVGGTDSSPAEIEQGENSCTSSASTFNANSEGCVFPISDVAGDFESRFMDATPDGSNVFIATKDQLVPEADADARPNAYDVRVGGGFPVSVPAAPCDNGDSCKAPVSPQPSIFAPSGSATFSGLGNPTSPSTATVTPKKKNAAEIKAEHLAKALKRCRKDKQKNKRANCEKQARKKYVVNTNAKGKKKHAGGKEHG
jgi:hypothetical protein